MFECIICKRTFKRKCELSLHQNFCKEAVICRNPECSIILKNPKGKYCSHSCSAKTENLKRGSKKVIIINCLFCNKEIYSRKKFCNQTCHINYKYKTLVEKWISNPDNFKTPRPFMKKWLIEIYGEKCSICNWCEINSKTKKVPIELHHKDGNWKNNTPENICLLCPNCHSLTPTYRFGNKGNGREFMRKYKRKR